MRVLVTGADGLLGNNLVRELLDSGYEVRVLLYPGSTSETLDELPIEKLYADITTDVDIIKTAIQGCQGVFHCAAITDMWADKETTFKVNVEGTRNILDAVVENGIKRLVFVGSASSFQFGPIQKPGNEEGGFAREYKGIPYMESKEIAMNLVYDYINKKNVDAVIVAPTFMLGPYDTRPSSGELIRQYLEKDLRFTSPGGRNFVYVKDVAKAMVLAFEKGITGERYILGNQNLTYADFFNKVAVQVNRNKKHRVIPRPFILLAGICSSLIGKITKIKLPLNFQMSKLSTLNTFYSCKKAVRELGMPQTPIEIAIKDSLHALKTYKHIK